MEGLKCYRSVHELLQSLWFSIYGLQLCSGDDPQPAVLRLTNHNPIHNYSGDKTGLCV